MVHRKIGRSRAESEMESTTEGMVWISEVIFECSSGWKCQSTFIQFSPCWMSRRDHRSSSANHGGRGPSASWPRPLRASEAYLAEAQRLSHTGSWAWNVATKRISGRGNLQNFLPRSKCTAPTTESLSTESASRDRASIERVESELLQGERRRINYRIVLPDKSIKYIESVAHPIRNDSGQVIELWAP